MKKIFALLSVLVILFSSKAASYVTVTDQCPFMRFTDETLKDILVEKSNIKMQETSTQVIVTMLSGANQTIIWNAAQARSYGFSLDGLYEYIDSLLMITCITGSDGDPVIVHAKNGNYTNGDTVKQGSQLTEPTVIGVSGTLQDYTVGAKHWLAIGTATSGTSAKVQGTNSGIGGYGFQVTGSGSHTTGNGGLVSGVAGNGSEGSGSIGLELRGQSGGSTDLKINPVNGNMMVINILHSSRPAFYYVEDSSGYTKKIRYDSIVSGGNGGATLSFAKTWAQIKLLATHDSLVAGAQYRIYSRPNNYTLDTLYIDAKNGKELKEFGVRTQWCPAWYDEDSYTGVGPNQIHWVGVWDSEKSVAINDRCVYGGRVWKNLTGSIGTQMMSSFGDPSSHPVDSLDATNWQLVSPFSYTRNEYSPLAFKIYYNLQYDEILQQEDNKRNRVGYIEGQLSDAAYYSHCIDITDWNFTAGREQSMGSNIVYFHDNIAAYGIYNNVITNGSLEYNTAAKIANNITENIYANTSYTGVNGEGISFNRAIGGFVGIVKNFVTSSITANNNQGITENKAYCIQNNSNIGVLWDNEVSLTSGCIADLSDSVSGVYFNKLFTLDGTSSPYDTWIGDIISQWTPTGQNYTSDQAVTCDGAMSFSGNQSHGLLYNNLNGVGCYWIDSSDMDLPLFSNQIDILHEIAQTGVYYNNNNDFSAVQGKKDTIGITSRKGADISRIVFNPTVISVKTTKVVPEEDSATALGDDTHRFSEIYVAGNSMHVGIAHYTDSGYANGATPVISPSGKVVYNFTTPRWVKVTKAYTDFATAGLTNDISIYNLPAKGYISDVKIVPTTAFSGGLLGTYTISVGIGGSLAKYAIATNVFTGNSTLSAIHTPLIGMESIGSTTDIRAQAISTVANLNAATAGSVDIYLLISTLP